MHVCNTHKNVRSVRAVYVHQKMCVQQVSVCTPHRRTHGSCYYVGANLCESDPTTKKLNNKKTHLSITILREHLRTSFMFFLISLTRTWSTIWVSTNHQMYQFILHGFPRHALVLILDDAFVWSFESEFWFIANYFLKLCESVCTTIRHVT